MALGEYKVINRALRILLSDYGASIALIGNIHGTDQPMIFKISNVMADGGFGLSTIDGDEATLKLQFTAHFLPEALDAEPWEIRAINEGV